MSRNFFIILWLVTAVVAIGGFVLVEQSHHPSAESSPVEKLVGEYDGFEVVSCWENAVAVRVIVGNPGKYIKALQDAMELAENKTGKKVAEIKCGGTPAIYYFYLQDRDAL